MFYCVCRIRNKINGKTYIGQHSYKGHKSNNGQHWYNNGKVSVMTFECPEGFKPGRLK